MDYAAKAKELREAIFSHAEQGHGGPCLRSGPLDKMLEEWLRLNCAPQVPSYPYGHRVLAEDQTGNGRHLVEKPNPVVSVNVGTWEGVRYTETPQSKSWDLDPSSGCASLSEIAKALATGQEAKLAAGIKITPELVEGLRKATMDALIYGTGFIGVNDGNLKALSSLDVLDDCAPRLDTMQTVWPDLPPVDPKHGDIYIGPSGAKSVWNGRMVGWVAATPGVGAKAMSRRELIASTDETPHTHQYTYKGMTRMEIVERMRKQRGFKPD